MALDIKLVGHYGLTAVMMVIGYFLIMNSSTTLIEFLGYIMLFVGIALTILIVLHDRDLVN